MATIKDIAKLANVSPATVSRVLNYDGRLSVANKTRERILKVAKDLGYKTPKQRNGAHEQRIKIGVLNWYSQEEELGDSYYLSIRKGIEKECYKEAIEVAIIFKEDNRYILDKSSDFDGLIAIGKFGKEDIKEFSKYSENIVFVDYSPDISRFDSVVIDCKASIEEALRYLLENNHKEIGYIGGREYIGQEKELIEDEREITYLTFVKRNNIYYPENIYLGEFTIESGYYLMKKAIKKVNLPTAFFLGNDSIAIGAMKALYEAKIEIPKEVSILGFNDIPAAKYLTPSLSTIRVHTEFMGKTAVEVLKEKISTNREIPKKIVIPCQFVIRDSSQ